MNERSTSHPLEDDSGSLLRLTAGVVIGALLGTLAIIAWLNGGSAWIEGTASKSFWYLSRASAFVAYALLWLSVVLGLAMSTKLGRFFPGGPVAFDLHQHASLLGLAAAGLHAGALLGDRYIGHSAAQVLVPFGSTGYRPLAVALGQVAFYVMLVVAVSSLVRRAIGRRTWRAIHYAGFLAFALALGHGIWSGTDSAAPWARTMYWVSAGTVLFLTFYRIVSAGAAPRHRAEAGATASGASDRASSGTFQTGSNGRRWRRLT